MFLIILRGGVVVVVPTTTTTHPGEVGGVAGTGAVATAEAVAPTEGGAIALVEAVRVDLPQLESITGPGPVPGGHFSPRLRLEVRQVQYSGRSRQRS